MATMNIITLGMIDAAQIQIEQARCLAAVLSQACGGRNPPDASILGPALDGIATLLGHAEAAVTKMIGEGAK